jgi:hypothetical protein
LLEGRWIAGKHFLGVIAIEQEWGFPVGSIHVSVRPSAGGVWRRWFALRRRAELSQKFA